MEDKLQSTIEKIVQLSKQNTEFNLGLRKRLDMSSANCVPIDDDRIDQIYEYCIEKVVRQQAQEFYKDFPIKEIITGLVDDFCRMEETISVIFACHYISKWNVSQTSYAQTRI